MLRRTALQERWGFTIIWLGQLVSLMGSGLSSFALGVWVFQNTREVTQFALVSVFAALPATLVAPFAGVLVDRWNRRWVMILSDTGAALGTLLIAVLFFSGRLEIWHIYVVTALKTALGTFQQAAYLASITQLVDKERLGRANGMVQLALAASQLVAPLLAGLLVATIRLQGVFLIDFVTFLCSIVTLLSIRFRGVADQPPAHEQKSLLREIAYAWSYMKTRAGILELLVFFTVVNFFVGIVSVLVTPLILAFTTPAMLGLVLSVGGSGMLVGAIAMSIWGGPNQRIYGVLGGLLICGFCLILAGLHTSVPLIAGAAFGFFFCLPIINSSINTIIQSHTAPHVQGRIFTMMEAIAGAAIPLAYLIAGPLADRVFEPLFTDHGALAGTVGQFIGAGPGRGIAFLFIVVGILLTLFTIGGYLYPRLHFVEREPVKTVEVAFDNL